MFTRISTPCSRLLLLSIRCLDSKSRGLFARHSGQPASSPSLPLSLWGQPASQPDSAAGVDTGGKQFDSPAARGVDASPVAWRLSLVDRGKKNASREPPKPANHQPRQFTIQNTHHTSPPPQQRFPLKDLLPQTTPIHRRRRSSVSLFHHVIPLGSLDCLTFTLGSAP